MTMRPKDITYTTDSGREYASSLDAATTLDQLRAHADRWKFLCPDAAAAIAKLDEQSFAEFQKAKRRERRGRFMGEQDADRFGDILMPEVLFITAMTAHQFNVPWGCAFIRLRDTGRIKVDSRGACRVKRRAA